MVDTALANLDDSFAAMYAKSGRPSVPPEMLLKPTVLMATYSMRSERAFCERLNYDMLKLRHYISSDHFSVDGTLLEAWASHKSFKPKDGDDSGGDDPKGRNSEVQWRGQKRSNDTHASMTDWDARLASRTTPPRSSATPGAC